MNAEIRAYVQVCDKCQGVNAKFTKANAKLHHHSVVDFYEKVLPALYFYSFSVSGVSFL